MNFPTLCPLTRCPQAALDLGSTLIFIYTKHRQMIGLANRFKRQITLLAPNNERDNGSKGSRESFEYKLCYRWKCSLFGTLFQWLFFHIKSYNSILDQFTLDIPKSRSIPACQFSFFY